MLEIVLHSPDVVRVPAGADTDTLQRVLQALQEIDMLTLPASVRVFVARGATRTCAGPFDRLSAQVQDILRQDPFSGHLFVFFNRQRNRVKVLVWERDGFWLEYKRLEAGTFAVLDRNAINARELYLLLEGMKESCAESVDAPLDYPSGCDDMVCDVAILHTLW